eukprot:TRINITY_DN881_c0_g1_i1.p1 TRINITY_DN881_c0_g1~~TRINITY_DN881_c0_g1_i1.p1  ORF type:complete len:1046 (-),score=253.08 TRINITY_DN881_c0_g1_i1:15-2750(-)
MPDDEFEQYWKDITTILIFLGDKEEELERIKTGLEDEPESEEANRLKEEGNKLYIQKRYNEAIQKYSEGFRIDSNKWQKAMLLCNRSQCYFCLGKMEKAKQDAQTAAEYAPHWFKPLYRLGLIAQEKGNYAKAIQMFDKALVLDPKNEQIIKERNQAIYLKGNIERKDNLTPTAGMSFEEQAQRETDRTANFHSAERYKEIIDNPLLKDLPFAQRDVMEAQMLVPSNPKRAFELFYSAGQKGNAEGMYNAGWLLAQGNGVHQDLPRAFELWKKAAKCKNVVFPGQRIAGVGEALNAIGNLYRDGVLVKPDQHTAFEYHKKSANAGCRVGMNNLGCCYHNGTGTAVDYKEAMRWYKYSASLDNVEAFVNVANLYKAGQGVPADLQKALEWYKKAYARGLEYVKPTIDLMEQVEPEHVEDLNRVHEILSALQHTSVTQTTNTSGWDPIELSKYADKSPSVKEILDSNLLFLEVRLILEKNKKKLRKRQPLSKEIESEIRHKIGQAFSITEVGVQWTVEERSFVSDVVERHLHLQPNDRLSMICQIAIRFEELDWVREYLKTCIKAHPEELAFKLLQAGNFALSKRWESSIVALNEIIKKKPDFADCYYMRGGAKRNLSEEDAKSAIQDYLKFLSLADKYNQKIPDAYYYLSQLHIKMEDKAKEYFQLGQKAEAALLPCFLPYHSNVKQLMQHCFEKDLLNQRRAAKLNASFEPDLNDPRRIHIIRSCRAANCQNRNSPPFSTRLTSKPPKKQSNVVFSSLKEIFLDDMDNTVDRVYNGRFLIFTIVERTFSLTGHFNIIQDEHGNLERTGFYNFFDPQQKAKIANFFKIGTKMKVHNPYMRIGQVDGQSVIRVDDPESVEVLGHTPICWYCTKPSASLSYCSKCRIAQYCSKECQLQDWKVLNHKDVCYPKET